MQLCTCDIQTSADSLTLSLQAAFQMHPSMKFACSLMLVVGHFALVSEWFADGHPLTQASNCTVPPAVKDADVSYAVSW